MPSAVYRILLERAVERDLRRLSAEIHDRIIRAIQGLGRNPRPPGCRKLTGTENDWRIGVGDYRVVYDIDDAVRVVRVMRVRHRRDVYRRKAWPIAGAVPRLFFIPQPCAAGRLPLRMLFQPWLDTRPDGGIMTAVDVLN
jgi:mRNA interferase RelE/StbE